MNRYVKIEAIQNMIERVYSLTELYACKPNNRRLAI